MVMPITDIAGRSFGRLIALEYVGNRKWRCACACGTEKDVHGTMLRSGRTQSCGCLMVEVRDERNREPKPMGSSSPRWMGDDVSYHGMHYRVRRARGRAASHPCTDCGRRKGRMQWSWERCAEPIVHVGGNADGLSYCLHTEHYAPRCSACHSLFDMKEVGYASAS